MTAHTGLGRRLVLLPIAVAGQAGRTITARRGFMSRMTGRARVVLRDAM